MAVKWHVAYNKLASALSKFFESNRDNPSLSFYKKCLSDNEILSTNNWLTRLSAEADVTETGIDPIQIFANLSDPNAKTLLRTDRIKSFGRLLQEDMPDEIDFSGCPTMFNIKVAARRPLSVQDYIWEIMSDTIVKKQDVLTAGIFGAIKGWYGINITSFTVFLFWIDAHFFLPTDQHTISYLTGLGLIKRRPKDYPEYLELLNNSKIKDYPSIVERAGITSLLESERKSETLSPDNQQNAISAPIRLLKKKNNEAKMPLWDGDMQIYGHRLLGIRIYKETLSNHKKVLGKGRQMYSFYKAFSFKNKFYKFNLKNDREIIYDPFKDVPLYQDGETKVHISAIVGENGSGKSTLIELILLAINNFTKESKQVPSRLENIKGIFVDIFFITDAIYKLSVQGDAYYLHRYERTGNTFKLSSQIPALDFDFDQFFYSIVNNYALYALNSDQIGNWVERLFHKNDQYQVPVNISPYRNKGSINIDRENGLMITRLVANLLLPVEKGKPHTATIRRLTASQTAERLTMKLDEKKLKYLYEYPDNIHVGFEDASEYWYPILSAVKSAFFILHDLPPRPIVKAKTYIDASWMYLIKKIISICRTYPDFEKFFTIESNTFDLTLLDVLIHELQRQKSHVTHKFYQVINFMNDDHLNKVKNTMRLTTEIGYEIEPLSVVIKEKVEEAKDNAVKTIHYAPPAFLKTDIRLTGDISIHGLSSGEKQRIYSVSSVLYHLINIDSNAYQDELVRYSSATIVFEEVELYFHPEMQRTFISYFLNYLNRVKFDVITSLNVIFVTHSPFILSDIPADNIIFLGKTDLGIKTFGSNIHTMLAESFFLKDGFMGEYAKNHISELIGFLSSEEESMEKWNINNSMVAISAIGEPLLRNRLLDIYRKKFGKGKTKEERIEALYNQIQAIQNEEN
jgi:predicted ATP-binding protein involved in virulence